MEHRQDERTLFFAEKMKNIVMLNPRHEQFRAVLENQPCPGFLASNGLQMAFENHLVTAGLLKSPGGDRVSGDGVDVRLGSVGQFVKRHIICPCARGRRS